VHLNPNTAWKFGDVGEIPEKSIPTDSLPFHSACGHCFIHPNPKKSQALSVAKDLALRIFMNIRDFSLPAAQNDSADEFFRSLL
jgi:hypothetical protein